jgi:hypothetical protein
VAAPRSHATAPLISQLRLPLEPLEAGARLPALAVSVSASVSAPRVRPRQVWYSLPLTEQLRAPRVFIQVFQEVVGTGDRC